MKKVLLLTVVFACCLFFGCEAGNEVEVEYISIAEHYQEFAEKIPTMDNAIEIVADLEQCATRIDFHAGRLSAIVSEIGTDAALDMISEEAMQQYTESFSALVAAISDAKERLGRSAIAPGARKIEAAVDGLQRAFMQ